MSFRLINSIKTLRRGLLSTEHGPIHTPFFMPIATKGAVKTVTTEEVRELGASILLSNTYHLYLRPGIEVIEKAGGLHQFMRWSRPILTDSGGYQVFSLSKMRKITEEGVVFQSHWDGSEHLLTPEKVIDIQLVLGSDVCMVLDECSPYPVEKSEAAAAVERTTRWAQRSKDHFMKKAVGGKLLFGIVQGSMYEDLRKGSAQQLLEIGFDGYAIGGLSVGEPESEMYRMLGKVVPQLPVEKPRYLMGVGLPENILEAAKRGVDMFDCVLPTRNARHGMLFVWKNRDIRPWLFEDRTDLFYETINITNELHTNDFSVIDPQCRCQTCASGYTKAYLRHLFKVQEPLALRLATLHNLRFFLEFMESIRASVEPKN